MSENEIIGDTYGTWEQKLTEGRKRTHEQVEDYTENSTKIVKYDNSKSQTEENELKHHYVITISDGTEEITTGIQALLHWL